MALPYATVGQLEVLQKKVEAIEEGLSRGFYKHKISLSGSPAETSDNATLVFFSTSATPVTTVALFENILLNGILYFESPESSLYAENGGDVESFKIVSASNEGSYMLFNMTMNLMDGTGTAQEINVNLAPTGDVVTQL